MNVEAKKAFLFPGQGKSVRVGMGENLYHHPVSRIADVARGVYERAKQHLGVDLAKVSFTGPIETLRDMRSAQPALLTASVAALEVMKLYQHFPDIVAGHSLGEYGALVAAGALSFENALRLVHRRGELMQSIGEKLRGKMVAVIGADEAQVARYLNEVNAEFNRGKAPRDQNVFVALANINSPTQLVIAGTEAAIDAVSEKLKTNLRARLIPVEVAAPGHTQLMYPIVAAFTAALEKVEVHAPLVAFIANATGKYVTTPAAIRTNLEEHLVRPVQWADTIQLMLRDGATIFYEVGPGNVLTGLMKANIGDRPGVVAQSTDTLFQFP